MTFDSHRFNIENPLFALMEVENFKPKKKFILNFLLSQKLYAKPVFG